VETVVEVLGIVVSQNSYNLWQTLLAWVLMGGAVIGGFTKLNKSLAKKDDIEKLKEQLSEVKEGNTKENTRIIALVEDLKDDFKTTEQRLDRHLEFGSRHQKDETNE
jgi:hypothetical protein